MWNNGIAWVKMITVVRYNPEEHEQLINKSDNRCLNNEKITATTVIGENAVALLWHD